MTNKIGMHLIIQSLLVPMEALQAVAFDLVHNLVEVMLEQRDDGIHGNHLQSLIISSNNFEETFSIKEMRKETKFSLSVFLSLSLYISLII